MKNRRAQFYLKIRQGGSILAILGLLFLPFTQSVKGATLDELRRKEQEARDRASQLKLQSQQKAGETENLQSTVNKLSNDIAGLESRINSTQTKAATTAKAIADCEAQIKQKEAALAANQRKQIEALQTLYVMGRESKLEIFLASESLSEVIARDEYLSTLENKIEEAMLEIRLLKEELEKKRTDLKVRQDELVSLNKQQQLQKSGLQEQQATKQRLLTDAKSEMAHLKSLALEQSRVEAEVEAKIRTLIAKKRSGGTRVTRGSDAPIKRGDIIGYEGSTGYSTGAHVHFEVITNIDSNPWVRTPPVTNRPLETLEEVYPKGSQLSYINGFGHPLDIEYTVTQGYGMTSYARGGAYGGKAHTGIDISAPYGSPVRAAGEGKIILDEYFGGYGNAVIIEHPNGTWTLYGHMTGD